MVDDNDFKELLRRFNRPWKGYRKVRKGVIKRIRRHMRELGCTGFGEYIAVLEKDEAASRTCEAHLRVTISRFCRDRQLWHHLENRLLPGLAENYPEGLNIWSAGCACGEEPYSLAILWDRLGRPTTLNITATDADPVCLERARRGIYDKSSLKELSPQCISSSFMKINASRFSVLPHLRENIRWHRHDLLDIPPQGPFQMIFLRNNVLTYYQQPVLGPAVERIVGRLDLGGFLVIGAHERLPEMNISLIADTFCPWIFQRRSS